ncbi:hypothetical protein [Streptomyces aidingensis]|uniref:Transcriptional regulator, AbiEi antitoxin, Type IV TA system n=1 Tax=Streptomyces aidingensis TaxID=910347 RepID=A0A1I1FD79_9ACTN|nr:hypothetical protein [Streptomyces aidingensis]SFB97439.1 hypothetical protein SAMN05421773_101692 [Streptomyces aidingensis]
MSNNTPHTPHTPHTPGSPLPPHPVPLRLLDNARHRVLTVRELRRHGIAPAETSARCRPGGPWQMPMPGVCLLHSGRPSGEELLQAALRWTGGREGETMVTGLAALALHGFTTAPPLAALDRMDILVPRTRRLRSTGCARIVRSHHLPRPQRRDGFPVAPVARALADAVGRTPDPAAVRSLLTEAVREGHCGPAALVRELDRARLLSRRPVRAVVEVLMAEGRAPAEERLIRLVRAAGLPEPFWNVDLRLPEGPFLGGVDAYWPQEAVAVEIDSRAHGPDGGPDDGRHHYARKRAMLGRAGIILVHLTPRMLRDAAGQQAEVVRAALLGRYGGGGGPDGDWQPPVHVVVLPR